MYVQVVVTPGAKKERCEKTGDAAFTVSVREPAERNMANRRVVEVIAEHFNVPPSRVRIISGHRSRKKVLSVEEGGL
ncbi:MAG: DUF167 domain-containing protein [Patescibacteria group bacterium]